MQTRSSTGSTSLLQYYFLTWSTASIASLHSSPLHAVFPHCVILYASEPAPTVSHTAVNMTMFYAGATGQGRGTVHTLALLGGVPSVDVNLSRFSIDSTGLGLRLAQWVDLILHRMAPHNIDFHQLFTDFFTSSFVTSVPSAFLVFCVSSASSNCSSSNSLFY